jgi:hypothetical protein
MSTEDEVDQFAAGLEPEAKRRWELEQRLAVRVQQDETEKLKANRAPDFARMTDAELREYTHKNFGF